MILRRLFRYLKPQSATLFLAVLFLLLAIAADLAGPLLIKNFIDDYLIPRSFPLSALFRLGGGYLLLLLAAAVFTYLELIYFQKLALRVIQQLRIDVFSHVQRLGTAFFDQTPAGVLVSRITNDTEAVKELFVNVLAALGKNSLFVLGVFAAMLFLDRELGLICLAVLPLILVLMAVYNKLSLPIFRVLRRKLGEINTHLNESLQGMGIIQALGRQKKLIAEFDALNQAYYQNTVKSIVLGSLMLWSAVDFICFLLLALVLSTFGIFTRSGLAEIGVLYAFINYIFRLFDPIKGMIQQLPQFQQALVSAERVFGLLDDPRLAPGKTGGLNPVIRQGQVEFRGVSFAYDDENTVLKNISFTVNPGQTAALVGHTGSGKSTVANLLFGFYRPQAGEIMLDGAALPEYDEKELRAKLGLVPQDPFLFAGDIKHNIGLGNPRAGQEEIVAAAQFVGAHDFIAKLPAGYDEKMSERGATLSGGQRQLLSFARAILANPRILVLDEATASIDTETETAIQNALAKVRRGRTTIVIAHRLSTIQEADQILVFRQGEIVERGTHQELLAGRGLYYKLYLLQQGDS
ncbi:Xenobiotic-transporting ATPase [Syntrophobotulus glycolicus DSM 8271]|uniref:Xenobiotic-transporting ATPase n=1 Tax=Syntrophobotulus glycolicus (strain DSM 8271 / FlGlyR) TaxID=645991 RepID=F0T2G1_SYNGF|nr:ABC transporter ATP-binding protein [Syntrophobotulus glycolicus]ADY55279.1 Xenobiotic-transporting ATPase [Syntrophobotulus glycolicus DSM 8271]